MSGVSGGKETGLMAAASRNGPRLQYSLNDVYYIGPRFYASNHTYITYAEFQNNGNDLLVQTYAGEATLSLTTAYDVSAGVSYKSGTATWVDADRYSNASYNALNNYNRLARIDVSAGKAYQYKIDGTTQIYSGLNSYTPTSLTIDSSSTSPFGGTAPNPYSSASNAYVQKSDGGIAILNATTSTDLIYLRNYANNTTTTVSSSSTLSISSLPISAIFLAAMSLDGTKVSIYYRNTSSQFDIQTWTLSTAFDLSTAGTPTASLNVGTNFVVNGGWTNRDPDHNRLVAWDQYGDIEVFSWTVDGDISTFTKTSNGNRSALGFYYSCCSSFAYFDNGNYVINYGYSGGSTIVYGPLTTPYDWQWEDGGFTPRSGYFTRWVSGRSDTGSVPPQDGQFSADKKHAYGGYYSSTLEVAHQEWGTAGNPLTAPNSTTSVAPFTGWTGGYSTFALWVDRNANKVHMVDIYYTSGSYFIFDLNANGTLAGTYNTSPSGYTPGQFQLMYNLQPLSSDGIYFVYKDAATSTVKIIELNVAYNPISGYTVVGEVPMSYLLPNGSTRLVPSPRLYVQDQIIFIGQDRGNKAARIDITIDGQSIT